MVSSLHSTVIPWDGNYLAVGGFSQETPHSDSAQRFESEVVAIAGLIDPFPWDGGKPQECYDNVTYLIDLLGGGLVYGWALADSGPLSAVRQKLPALYARWINHAVWRDGGGKLWEVTPRFEVGNVERVAWSATQFTPDPQAVFHVSAEGRWSQPARYVALRPEGARLADLLCRAERETDDLIRAHLLRASLAQLALAGFIPKECRVEASGTRPNNIWLIVE